MNFNWLDYSNGLFDLLYSKVAVEDIEAYLESLDRPGTELEQFLDERGYTEKAYFLDIAGTKCLRDMRYADAVRILFQVSNCRIQSKAKYRTGTVRPNLSSEYDQVIRILFSSVTEMRSNEALRDQEYDQAYKK